MRTIARTRFVRATTGVAALLALSALAMVAAIGASGAAPQPVGWPSFTMVYTVEGSFRGLDQPSGTMTWRVEYSNAKQWTKTLVDSTVDPRAVGETQRFDGTTFTTYSAVTNTSTTTPQDGVWVDWWLIPWRDLTLTAKGYAQAPGTTPNLTVFTKRETQPCQPDPERKLTGIVQPAVCATSPTFDVAQTAVYRRDSVPAMPVTVTTQVDGATTSQIRVTALTLRQNGQERVLIP